MSYVVYFEKIYELVYVRITVVQDNRALKLNVTYVMCPHSQPDIIVNCSYCQKTLTVLIRAQCSCQLSKFDQENFT